MNWDELWSEINLRPAVTSYNLAEAWDSFGLEGEPPVPELVGKLDGLRTAAQSYSKTPQSMKADRRALNDSTASAALERFEGIVKALGIDKSKTRVTSGMTADGRMWTVIGGSTVLASRPVDQHNTWMYSPGDVPSNIRETLAQQVFGTDGQESGSGHEVPDIERTTDSEAFIVNPTACLKLVMAYAKAGYRLISFLSRGTTYGVSMAPARAVHTTYGSRDYDLVVYDKLAVAVSLAAGGERPTPWKSVTVPLDQVRVFLGDLQQRTAVFMSVNSPGQSDIGKALSIGEFAPPSSLIVGNGAYNYGAAYLIMASQYRKVIGGKAPETAGIGRKLNIGRGHNIVTVGRFIISYPPQHADGVEKIRDGLLWADKLYENAGYTLPKNIHAKLMEKPFGSPRSFYSWQDGGYMQFTRYAFSSDGGSTDQANKMTVVHELAHYYHFHAVRDGRNNRALTSKYHEERSKLSRKDRKVQPGEDTPNALLAKMKVMESEAVTLQRKAIILLAPYGEVHIPNSPFTPEGMYRIVPLEALKNAGVKFKARAGYISVYLMQAVLSVDARVIQVNLAVATPQSDVLLALLAVKDAALVARIRAISSEYAAAIKTYNDLAHGAGQKDSLTAYDTMLSKWFPTEYATTKMEEWVAELISARLVNPKSLDEDVIHWIDGTIGENGTERLK